MKKNITIIAGIVLGLSLGCVALAGVSTYADNIESRKIAEAATTTYTLTLSSTKNHVTKISNSSAKVKTDLGNDITLYFGKYKTVEASTGNWMTFPVSNNVDFTSSSVNVGNVGGFINNTRITGIARMMIVMASDGDITLRWSHDNKIYTEVYNNAYKGEKKVCSFNEHRPDKVMIGNSGESEVTIESITYYYDCA